jgi:hypothetical protein
MGISIDFKDLYLSYLRNFAILDSCSSLRDLTRLISRVRLFLVVRVYSIKVSKGMSSIRNHAFNYYSDLPMEIGGKGRNYEG